MMHKPIQLKHLSLSVPHKICFDDFNQQILYGNRIAIIGRNGSGKSSLLHILQGIKEASDGEIVLPTDLRIGYVPQIIEKDDSLSGAERFNSALTQALLNDPNLLLLDEPTNHLDKEHYRSLMKLLNSFQGTLIVVTHDVALIRHTFDRIWHIDQGEINVFSGHYDDYIQDLAQQEKAITQELARLERQKKEMHKDLMKEQQRAKQSRLQGEKHIQQKKWPTIVSYAKARNAQETSGQKKNALRQKKNDLLERLADCRQPERLKPNFKLTSSVGQQTILSITDGCVGYPNQQAIIHSLRLSLCANQRIVISGNNGCGKSTLLKAMLEDHSILKQGEWLLPKRHEIGYLDQHYNTLSADKTVLEIIQEVMPSQSYLEIRKHLNDFLFRKNEEIEAYVATLSGGERARLSLAQIAAISPKLLILDEVTNNLDGEARQHIIEVLQAYPGAVVIVSHDDAFLSEIKVTENYEIVNHRLLCRGPV